MSVITPNPALKDLWALVIEDDAHDLLVIQSLLTELGIHCKRNTSGFNAVAQAVTMNPHPRFVLLDMALPRADSLTLCRALCYVLPRTPVIGMGSADWLRQSETLREAGFATFIPKPLPRRRLGHLLADILAGKSIWPESV